MEKMICSVAAIGALCSTLVSVSAADELPGFVDFGTLNPSGESQFVEVNIKSNLIAMVASLAKKAEPEVATMIEALKQVRVNVMGVNQENRDEMKKKVTSIRETLDKKGWERIVTAIEKNQDVGVYLKTKDAKTVEGICVTVVDGNQVVLVNVVGNIQPEKLATVGERFDIEPLKHIPIKPRKDKEASDSSEKEKEATKS